MRQRRLVLVLFLGFSLGLFALPSCSEETAAASTPPPAGQGGAGGNLACTGDDGCSGELICVATTCVPRDGIVCAEHLHCEADSHCEGGLCEDFAPCTGNASCPVGESCQGGSCEVDPRTPCTEDRECLVAGEVCLERFCTPGDAVDCLTYDPPVVEDVAAGRILAGELVFGSAPNLGDVRTVPVTVTNGCERSVSVFQVAFESTTSPEFSVAAEPTVPLTLAPGRSVELLVTYAPADLLEEGAGQVLAINSDDLHPTARYALTVDYKGRSRFALTDAPETEEPLVASHNFGPLPVGESTSVTFFLKNAGTGNRVLRVSTLAIDGAGSVFSVEPARGPADEPLVLAPLRGCSGQPDCGTGQSCDAALGLCRDADGSLLGVQPVTVTFAPTAARPELQRLLFEHDEGGAGELPGEPLRHEVVLTGGGGNPPVLVVSPASLDFGEVELGTDATLELRVENAGDQTLVVEAVRLGSGLAGFSASPGRLGAIPSGGFQTVTVRYVPGAGLGAAADTVLLDSNDPVSPTTAAQLAALAVDPVATVTPASVDFGDVSAASPSLCVVVEAANAGVGTLELLGARITAGSDPSFTLQAPPLFPVALPDAAAPPVPLTVCFTRQAPGARAGALAVTTSDFQAPELLVPLSALGLDDCGDFFRDRDQDGFGDAADTVVACAAPVGYVAVSGDCDDGRSDVRPGAPELCDGVDNDCDGGIDEGLLVTVYADGDRDGYGDPAASSLACGVTPGFSGSPTDCDDRDAGVHPGALERCNGIDDDCSGATADGSSELWFGAPCDGPDGDLCEEGSWGCGAGLRACSDLTGTTEEICNGLDDDCDGAADDGTQINYYRDADGDGHGFAFDIQVGCAPPVGYVAVADDCDDGRAAVFPGALELCDGLDTDCNAATPDGAAEGWVGTLCDGADSDFCAEGTLACIAGAQGCTDATGDNQELCNGADDDCDGLVDEGANGCGGVCALANAAGTACDAGGAGDLDTCEDDAFVCVGLNSTTCTDVDTDLDNDGYSACGDCDDTRSDVRPGAVELCDGIDNDCDTLVDEDGLSTFYRDADGDGQGNPALSTQSCSLPAGYVASSTDCNDARADVYVGAPELCDGADNDCDGFTDEGLLLTFYRDADADGYGNAALTIQACTVPGGYAAVAGDCADADATRHPGAAEGCNGLDDDCDGDVDEGSNGCGGVCALANAPGAACDAVGATDLDACTDDAFVCTGLNATACTDVDTDADDDGYSACGDCDDGNAARNPAALELCNGSDDDCDGVVDEGGNPCGGACALGAIPGGVCDSPADLDACNDDSVACSGLNATVCVDLDFDADDDGYSAGPSCTADCDDGNAARNPAALELCNSVDDDCDGTVDDGGNPCGGACALANLPGAACDFFGADDVDTCEDDVFVCTGANATACADVDNDADGDGYSAGLPACGGDCADADPLRYPGLEELCDGLDNDCDGQTDEDGAGCAGLCCAGACVASSPTDCGACGQACSAGLLVINELQIDPAAVVDTVGEWFELYNPNAFAVDLRGFVIRDLGADTHTVTSATPVWVPAGGLVVLGPNATFATNGGVTVAYQYSGVALGNTTGDELLVVAHGTELDRVVWPGTFDVNGSSKELSRSRATTVLNDTLMNWCTAIVVYGAGDRGTPGAPNSCNL